MSHNIHVILAKKSICDDISQKYDHAHVLDLVQDFALIPMTASLIDEIQEEFHSKKNLAEGFVFLNTEIMEFLSIISEDQSICYFETRYNGAVGTQSALMYMNKQLIGPYHTETIWDEDRKELKDIPKDHRAVNKVLYKMDVHCKYRDEFGALNLPRYNSMEIILKALNN